MLEENGADPSMIGGGLTIEKVLSSFAIMSLKEERKYGIS